MSQQAIDLRMVQREWNIAGPVQAFLVLMTLGIGIPYAIAALGQDPSNWRVGLTEYTGVMLSLLMATALIWRRGHTWRDYGLSMQWAPKKIAINFGLGVLIMIGVLLIAIPVKLFIVLPLVEAQPDTSKFEPLQANLPLLLFALAAIWSSAAFGEEMLMRGFSMTWIAESLGGRRIAWIASLLVCAVMFGAMHYYQGLPGMLMTGFVGFLFGVSYLLLNRNLWPNIIAHGLIDTLALLQFYFAPAAEAGAG